MSATTVVSCMATRYTLCSTVWLVGKPSTIARLSAIFLACNFCSAQPPENEKHAPALAGHGEWVQSSTCTGKRGVDEGM